MVSLSPSANTTEFIKRPTASVKFRLPLGQRIYLAARDDWTDNWTRADGDDDDESREHVSTDMRAERLAREEFACLRIQHRHLLVARMQITPYNLHVLGSFPPSLGLL